MSPVHSEQILKPAGQDYKCLPSSYELPYTLSAPVQNTCSSTGKSAPAMTQSGECGPLPAHNHTAQNTEASPSFSAGNSPYCHRSTPDCPFTDTISLKEWLSPGAKRGDPQFPWRPPTSHFPLIHLHRLWWLCFSFQKLRFAFGFPFREGLSLHARPFLEMVALIQKQAMSVCTCMCNS